MPVMFIPAGVWLLTAWGILKPVCAYKFNMLDKDDAAITGAAADDQFAVGIVYQF